MKIITGLTGLILGLGAVTAPHAAHAQSSCVSWGEARSSGMLKKYTMRPANEIKQQIEKKHGGKVVSFQICQEKSGLKYKLAVFRDDGNVIFVTEPASKN